ncbi:MAG TPA: hypothetical protein VF909_02640, partial [Roseiflexaceae bacterium]
MSQRPANHAAGRARGRACGGGWLTRRRTSRRWQRGDWGGAACGPRRRYRARRLPLSTAASAGSDYGLGGKTSEHQNVVSATRRDRALGRWPLRQAGDLAHLL